MAGVHCFAKSTLLQLKLVESAQVAQTRRTLSKEDTGELAGSRTQGLIQSKSSPKGCPRSRSLGLTCKQHLRRDVGRFFFLSVVGDREGLHGSE